MIEHHEAPPPALPRWATVYADNAQRLVQLATVLVGADDARDLVSDAVRRAVHSPAWTAVRDERAYLVRSLVNEAATRRRSDGRRVERERRAAEPETARATLDPTDLLDGGRALATLSPQQRAVVFLAYWDDRTIPEIAAWLDVSEGTIRRQLDRAKTRLRAVLR